MKGGWHAMPCHAMHVTSHVLRDIVLDYLFALVFAASLTSTGDEASAEGACQNDAQPI